MPTKIDTGIILPLLRGDVYLVNLDPIVGKEITKPLPIMIFLEKGEGGLNVESYVDCGQIRTIDKGKRLITKLGSLSKSIMNEIDKALKISLSLQ